MSSILSVASLLGAISAKVFDAIVGRGVSMLTERALRQIQSDPAKIAFQQALGNALERYAGTGNRASLVQPLLQPDSPLVQESVAEELARLLTFSGSPDIRLIADRWQASLQGLPQWRDMSYEVQLLLQYLEEELHTSEVFGPVLDSKSLEQINTQVQLAARSLASIETRLAVLNEIMDEHLGKLLKRFAMATPELGSQICDFTWYIEEKTHDFTGRDFVFQAFEHFQASASRGYYFIQGDPGIGKTALASQLVRKLGVAHHFNIRALGIHKRETFLKSICSQLIVTFGLKYDVLPPGATNDGGFFRRILEEIARQLQGNQRAILVVDALDEVGQAPDESGSNLLYLPPTLPQHVYLFATRRKPLPLRIDCEQDVLLIRQDDSRNLEDIRAYLKGWMERPGLQQFARNHQLTIPDLTEHLVDKSQGNFMYLRYVLPEIEHGGLQDVELATLPTGLENYYEDHWQRMRGRDPESWYTYKLPVLAALSVASRPISLDLIADFSQVADRRRIRAVLREWDQFLHEEKFEYEGSLQSRWRMYHDSFREFTEKKDEVAEEMFDLQAVRSRIAADLYRELRE